MEHGNNILVETVSFVNYYQELNRFLNVYVYFVFHDIYFMQLLVFQYKLFAGQPLTYVFVTKALCFHPSCET